MAVKYYVDPFAVSGDVDVIPNPIQISGSVSYTEGFGTDYQRDLGTDPDALSFPRKQFNQLMLDITLNIQQYQQHGVPEFITTADNLGTPFSYDAYAVVRYDAGGGYRNYISLVDSNTDTPPSSNWMIVDPTAVIQPGMSITYRGGSVLNGYLLEDGASYLRSDYPALFASIGTLYGSVDSTHFNVPDTRRRTNVGSGGTATAVLGNTTGSVGGTETISLTPQQNGPHQHTFTANSGDFYGSSGTPAAGPGTSGSPFGLFTKAPAGTTDLDGNGDPHNNIQPGLVATMMIKY